MGTVVNTASIVQYHSIHDPSLYVKKRLKDHLRPIMMVRSDGQFLKSGGSGLIRQVNFPLMMVLGTFFD